MKTFNNYFATTAGAAGVCGCPTTQSSRKDEAVSQHKEHKTNKEDGGTATIHEWKPHPKSTAKPDFSSWPGLKAGAAK